VGRPVAAFVTCIEDAARLNKQQFDLVLGIRLVFNALRHDKHFASGYLHCAIAKIDPQSAF
jgi:hypothetical protein